ncbi:metallopeptidase TldD-related protein [Actinokineospora auranticolor]|uniref:TldD protein n=1 Tax=Actinokineospora auranticolor TaxID=155976 RepID=A0A2S6GPH5_9PSEU|nr:metallopeptidase TldD-related protein [Actinokineospora auranticolor]PPK67096.1 TldD protein [Actinokineospora auranticolor]
MSRAFAEHTLWVRHRWRPDEEVDTDAVRTRGACVETERDGVTEHRVDDAPAPGFAEVYDRPLREVGAEEAADLAEAARRTGAEITVGVRHQHVVAGDPDDPGRAERRIASTEVRVYESDGTSHAAVTLRVTADVDPLADQVRSRLALPRAGELPAGADLVLPPGLAGSFFHEVVGHPMEADVVASGTSHLGGPAGRVVAPWWLTVADGATTAAAGYRSEVDDEGTPCREVRLIDAGRVGEPMTDRALAARLDLRPSGHARRQSYRAVAIPRMTHTHARVDPGADLTAPDGDWIAAHGLKLLMMNIATGEFAFRVSFAVAHLRNGTARRCGPFEVLGDASRALRGLQPHTHESGEYGRVTGGCGKLGQFPVPVTFANAGVRLPSGTVALREVARG